MTHRKAYTPLLRALYGRLAGKLSAPVFSAVVPTGTPFPYVCLGRIFGDDASTKTDAALACRVEIAVWDGVNDADPSQLQDLGRLCGIMDEIAALMTATPLDLGEGWTAQDAVPGPDEITPDPVAGYRLGVSTYEIEIEQEG